MKRVIEFWTIAALLSLLTPGASALMAAEKVDLKVGDPAPVFEAQDDAGNTWKVTDHVGKKVVVVYFYPADCTGGCTKQAVAFTNDLQALADKGLPKSSASAAIPSRITPSSRRRKNWD